MRLYQAIYDVAKDFYPTAEEVNHFEIKSIASQIMERPEIWLTFTRLFIFNKQEKYIRLWAVKLRSKLAFNQILFLYDVFDFCILIE